jgi:hypothetical protein
VQYGVFHWSSHRNTWWLDKVLKAKSTARNQSLQIAERILL